MTTDLERLWEIEDIYGRHYPQRMVEKAHRAVKEFIEEMGDVGKCTRLIGLWERLEDVEADIKSTERRYQEDAKRGKPYLDRAITAHHLPELRKLRKKLKMQIRLLFHPPRKSDITPEMIAHARDYPLSALVEVNARGFARCVAHEDKNPSMYCKNNFAHCFSCGFTGDVIDVFMKRECLDFKAAVRRLA